MATVRSKFVMHLVVESPRGTMSSGKPPGAASLERALATSPGNPSGTLGHPGKRFAVACGVVPRLTREHRGSTDARIVNCPQCRTMIARKEKALAKA